MAEQGETGFALPSDDDLLARAIEGEAEAYGDLYERHLQAIYRYIYYRIGETRQAEDMTEEVFLKVWETLPRFRVGEISFRSWLYRVAHNMLVDYYRTHKDEVPLSEQLEQASTSLSVERLITAKKQQRSLWEALDQLAEDHRSVLILRFINELNHAEVAQVLNRSEGAMRVLQHRALKALAEKMTELSGENRDS